MSWGIAHIGKGQPDMPTGPNLAGQPLIPLKRGYNIRRKLRTKAGQKPSFCQGCRQAGLTWMEAEKRSYWPRDAAGNVSLAWQRVFACFSKELGDIINRDIRIFFYAMSKGFPLLN